MTSDFKCIEAALKKLSAISFRSYKLEKESLYQANLRGENDTHTFIYDLSLNKKYPHVFTEQKLYSAKITIRPVGSEDGGYINRFRMINSRVKKEKMILLKQELLRVDEYVASECKLKIRPVLFEKFSN